MATLRHHGAMTMPAGSLMEHRQNMAKSIAGFLEKPAIIFAMFFKLGITALSNIATKPSFFGVGPRLPEVFHFFWCPSPTNRGDYWTKHHCAAHHIEKRPEILTA